MRENQARIKYKRGSLMVVQPSGDTRIPLESIDAVMMLGSAQITTDAIAECVKRNIRVAALNRGGSLRFFVGGPTGGNVHLRSALYGAVDDEKRSLSLARIIVAAKLQNSLRILRRWARDEDDTKLSKWLEGRASRIAERISHLPSAISADHVRGIEGDAARIYFAGIRRVLETTSLEFQHRNRRPPRDPVNALLGYCYGLFLAEMIGAIEATGLDFQMGFFHRPRSGRPSLALDLTEEFRPLVDRTVVTIVRRRQIRQDDFVETPGGGVYLNEEGKSKLLRIWEAHKEMTIHHFILDTSVERWALPSIQATLLARHLRGDIPNYAPFVLPQ